jgi:hypothetical protein
MQAADLMAQLQTWLRQLSVTAAAQPLLASTYTGGASRCAREERACASSLVHSILFVGLLMGMMIGGRLGQPSATAASTSGVKRRPQPERPMSTAHTHFHHEVHSLLRQSFGDLVPLTDCGLHRTAQKPCTVAKQSMMRQIRSPAARSRAHISSRVAYPK